MTVHPIMLDLSGSDGIEYSNIESMVPIPCIDINVSQIGICSWITSGGGIGNITIPAIFILVDAYIDPSTGLQDIGFVPTIGQIFGVVDYYLGFIADGNTETGCNF
jgi:hypothetical protein